MELLFLSIYIVVVMAVGYFSKNSHGDEDYVIGSRRIERFGTTMTIFATLVTESLLFFAVSLTALYGPFGPLAGVAGPSLALLTLSMIAPKVHAEGVENRYISVTEYCKQKWGPVSGRLAQIVLLMLLAWIVVLQVNLNEKIMFGITGWTPVFTTAVTVCIVLLYTLLGGYRAVISTDIFQGIVICLMFLLPIFIAPRPDLTVILDAPLLSVNVLLLFLTSYALTITRPEMWQRIYSASSGQKAAHSMRIVAVIFFAFGCFVEYYALAVLQASPGSTPDQAFAVGYRKILPPIFAALFPVLLLAAMMSSLDSAAFLLSVDLASLRQRMRQRRTFWSRVFLSLILIGAGIVSLTIFKTLTFAYKLNGIVALFAIPLLMSFRLAIPNILLGVSILVGFAAYTVLLLTGRIDRNPAETILAALVTGVILVVGYVVRRFFFSARPGPSRDTSSTSEAN